MLRRCNKFVVVRVVAISNNSIGHVLSVLGNVRKYSKDKGCCPDVPQTEGKKVEPWPKPDPAPPAWRCECPKEPQPPNYDPYRIKVPDVVVPPIPTSNAKWTGMVFTVDQPGKESAPSVSQQPTIEQTEGAAGAPGPEATDAAAEEEEEQQSEGFFARLGNLFGMGKRKKGQGDEVPTEDGREPFRDPEHRVSMSSNLQDLFYDSPIVHPDYWKDKSKKGLPAAAEAGVFPRLGYHGRSKYKYAFHEPWKPLDRVTLIAQAEKEEFEVAGAIDAAEKTNEQVTT